MDNNIEVGSLVEDSRGGINLVLEINNNDIAYLLELKKGINWNYYDKRKWCVYKNTIYRSKSITFSARKVSSAKLIKLLYGE